MTRERLGRIVEESASEVYIFHADDFRFALVNKGARNNLGFGLEELRSLRPWDLKPELPEPEFRALVEPLFTGAAPLVDFETVHRRKDGSEYDVAVRLQLMRHEGDAVFYAAVQDVTELNLARRALEEASTRLDAIIRNTTMAMFMMDDRQHCVFMNPAAEELTGYTLEETVGRTLHDVVHHTYPDGRPFPIDECAIDRAFPEESQTKGEEIFVHKDGSFYPVGFTASPIRDDNGKTVGTVIEARDITDELAARKAMEDFNRVLEDRVEQAIQDRKKLENQLLQAQKMEAVGQLTGGVAHDFNNLLQVIGGNLQLLEQQLIGDDRKQRHVANALAGVQRGAKLAAQLLAFGRQQPLDPKPTNIGRLVREMDDMFRRTLGEAIEIETVIQGGLWNCLVDRSQIENVLLNLAINARDAMEGAGKLTIEAGNASLDDAYAAEHVEVTPGQYVMLAVTDTGSGIPADIIEKVFDPFFTTKEPGKGTGLGLSMVFGFVKQSGGHVKLYSEEGEGTTVRLYLPRTRQAEEIVPIDPKNVPLSQGGETILVVEDDASVRATSVELLSALGYSVLEAPNADSALAIVNSGVKIDMLFTDVVMPGNLRSPELARLATQRLPGLKVLFTSGYTQNAIVHSGRLDDGVELIAKPFSRERLAQKIRAVLMSEEPVVANEPPQPAASRPVADAGRSGTRRGGRVLLVEDEILIRMTTSDMLAEDGLEVIEVGTVAGATQLLSQQQFDVVMVDLGLPDGSGADVVQGALAMEAAPGIIIASGRDAAESLAHLPRGSRVVHLAKPYTAAMLQNALEQVRGS